MWNRGAGRSSVLEKAKAQLSGQRITNSRPANATKVSFEEALPQSRQNVLYNLNDLSLDTESEKQDPLQPPKVQPPSAEFAIGGGSRFLKKSVKSRTSDDHHPETNDVLIIPHRSSQSTALSNLVLIEGLIKTRKNVKQNIELGSPPSVKSSSESHAASKSHFLKKKKSEVVVTPVGTGVTLDSDEEDMQRLLGGSFDAQTLTYRNCTEANTVPAKQSENTLGFTVNQSEPPPRSSSPSPRVLSPSNVSSQRSLSSASGHSNIQSLEDLFSIASHHDDVLSDRSVLSDDFKPKVLSLDDLGSVLPTEPEQIQNQSEATHSVVSERSISAAEVRSEDGLKSEQDALQYESDFEDEIQTDVDLSMSEEISEDLSAASERSSAAAGPQSCSASDRSQDDGYTLSKRSAGFQSLTSLSPSTDSYSSKATVTHTEPYSGKQGRKDATVQTQEDRIGYVWASGCASIGPSIGMSYVDPSPVVTHTISTEAVEALSAYSPAVLALNDMLKQQLTLTRSLVQTNRYLHQTVLESLGPADYKYTTLEDTKEFIRCNRRPRLSVEDALEEVLQEMRDYHFI